MARQIPERSAAPQPATDGSSKPEAGGGLLRALGTGIITGAADDDPASR